MKISTLLSVSLRSPGLAMASAVLALGLVLASCGGGSPAGKGGTIPYTGTGFNTRPLPQEFLSRQAINYSPYRTGNREAEMSAMLTNAASFNAMKANVLQDLTLLQNGNIRLIRLFATDAVDPFSQVTYEDKGLAKLILDVINDNSLDIKVQLGLWVNNPVSTNPSLSTAQNQAIINAIVAANNAEIARGVKLAKDYEHIVLAVSVGNEMMVNWSANMRPDVMAAYITTLRNQISQPVTSDDDWSFWAQKNGNTASPTPVLNVIDFVAMHSYPMSESIFNQWDWRQSGVAENLRARAMMDAAVAKLKIDYNAVRANLDAHGRIDLPIVIGETGWRAVDTGEVGFRASPINQQMYYVDINTWKHSAKLSGSGPANIFHFEAFDEPWKGGDDKWGLFNVNRQARCAVQGLSVSYTAEPGSCSAAGVYWQDMPRTVVGANQQYTVYADATTPGEVIPTIYWNGWSGAAGWTISLPSSDVSNTASDPSDGAGPTLHGKEITPVPATWGWGVAVVVNNPFVAQTLPQVAYDLSAMGYLNFSIKTDYPGKIEVGFVSGSVTESSAFEVYMPIAVGQYGYLNDGNWHHVKIPISDLVAHASTGLLNGLDNRGNRPDLRSITQPFVIADRYISTGNVAGATNKVNIDRIFWSAN